MTPEVASSIKSLLAGHRVGALGVLVDGRPYVGHLPYALWADLRGAVVLASQLARHTRGMGDGAPFSLLVAETDGLDSDPRQLARLTLEGTVTALTGDRLGEARALYLERFPQAAPTLDFADFALYELHFDEGHYVGGFANTVNLRPESFAELARA